MNEISEKTLNEELNRIFLMKISVQRKLITLDCVQHGDPKFGAKKFRIFIIRVTA